MDKQQFEFFHHDKVRDYECDIQGVVNNSVYQNYLEHARHEMLLDKGVDFAAFAARGINLVVVRTEVDYRSSLVPGDKYKVGVTLSKLSKVRFEFQQAIFREGQDKPAIEAKVIGTALNERGRPCAVEDIIGDI